MASWSTYLSSLEVENGVLIYNEKIEFQNTYRFFGCPRIITVRKMPGTKVIDVAYLNIHNISLSYSQTSELCSLGQNMKTFFKSLEQVVIMKHVSGLV